MDLAELKFVVDTKQLEEAAKKIDELGVAVSKVNKPVTKAALESEKLALAQAKVAEAAAKAETAQVKLEQAQSRSGQTTGKSVSVLERQNMILGYMAEGLSKGQASYMATAKAAGALDGELKELVETLKIQRTLQGSEPFDKSIGLMQKLTNETKIVNEVNELFNRNLGLTEKQMTDLAREKERLTALYNFEGKSLNGLNKEYEQIIQKTTETNRANNARVESMKAQIKAQSDAAKATAYLADADARLAAALSDTNKSLDKQATDALVKYEKALKQTGMSADEAAAKLAVAKKQFEGIADKKQADRLQYLARAISVQMGDVGISLASGMNPLLVMIQQGDQIRGAIQQAGASGKELENAMAGAATQIATSFLQTGQAIGGFFVNAVKSAGKAIVDLPISIASSAIGALAGNVETSAVAFDRLKVAAISFGKVGIVAIIATLAALAIEYVKVTAAEKELTKSLAMSGAALGMSTTDAITYAESMNKVGIGTMDAMRMIAEFANTGADASIPLKEIISSAQDMQKYVGIASADTMKAFADISEKPVEGLIKLAKSTGNVTAETILQAEAAIKAGNNAEAARIAQEALSNSNEEVVKRMKNNLDPLQTLWMDIKSGISKAGEALYDFLKSSTMIAVFRTVWETIAVIVTEVWYVLKQTGNEISGIFSQIKAVMSGDFAGAARIGNQMKIDAEAARIEQDKLVASIMNRNKAEKETLTVTEDQRKANRQAAKEIEDRIKKDKAPKTDAEKERLRLLKESEKYLSRISSLTNAATKEQENYTKAQKLALDIFSDPDFKNYPESQRIKIANAIEQAHAEELIANELTKQRAIQKQIHDEYVKLQEDRDKLGIAALDNSLALNKAVKEESDELIFQATLIGKTDEERKRSIKTRQAELLLAKELADIESKGQLGFGVTKESLREEAYQRFADRTKNINTEIANDFAAEMQKQYDVISNGLSDAVITGLFEGGKAGRKKLRDLIVAELKKPIRLVIDAVINATLGSFISSLVGGSAGSSFAGSAAGSAATGGITNMTIGGATLGAQAGAFGQGIASGFSLGAPVSSMGGATSASFNMGATYGAPVAGALGGMAINRGISNGYKVNNTVNTIQDIGTVIAAAINPVFGIIAGTVSGIFNRAFGRKLTDVGIRGTLGGESGFEGERYTFEKGGFLRSDKTRTSVLEEADRSAIASDFRLIKNSVMDLAESAGFGSDALKDFTAKFQINLKDLSPEDAVKKYQEEFAKIEESMAAAVIGTSGYRRENETNIQALTRIASFMSGINGAFKKLGFETYKLELASLDAAQSFVDLFGGIEGFNKATTFFYENFFSVEERMVNLATDLTTEFDKLGVALPKTREEFRALVVAARAAGDDQQVKNLLDLQYAFAELVPVTETVTDAVGEVIEVMTKNMQELLKERDNLNIQLMQLSGRADLAAVALRKIATEGFTEAEIAAYDYNENLKLQIQSYKDAAELAKKLAEFTKQRSNLEVELLRVQGRTREADVAAHALATEGMSRSEIAAYDYNEMLRTQIDYLKMVKDAADAYAQVVKGLADEQTNLNIELLKVQGRTTEANAAIRALATGAMQPAEVAAYDYNNTLRDQIQTVIDANAAAEAYAQRVKGLADEQTNLQIELLKVQGKTTEANAALRALAIEGLEATEVAAYDYNNTLRDQIELTQKLNEFAKEKSELEVELLRAQGRTAEANAAAYALATEGMQEAEIAAYDYNQSLKAQIQSYADLKTTTDSTFTALQSSIQSSITELEKSFSATDTALSNVEKAISAERELAQVRLDSALKEEQAIKDVFDVLKKSISEIRGQTIGGAASSKGLIADAIKSGRLPDAAALSDAISDVKTSIDDTAYVSIVDQKRASLLFANQLEDLQKIAEPQLSSAEQAVILAQENVDILDANLKVAQEQVSILRGIDVNILSVSQALTALYSAMNTETSARTQIGGLNTELQTATEQYNTLRNVDTSIVPLVTALLNFQSALANETDNIVSPSLNIPSASLNVASAYSATQGTAVTQSTSSNTVLELQALRAELTLLRSETVATALNTGKTAKILDRATQENGAILVVSEA